MRKRNIDPGFFNNPELGGMEPFTRIFFAGTWCLADWHGNLEENPKRLKALIFPYDQVEVETCIETLVVAGMLRRYERVGKRFLQVTNFRKHQSISGSEKRNSKTLPEPENVGKNDCVLTSVGPDRNSGLTSVGPDRNSGLTSVRPDINSGISTMKAGISRVVCGPGDKSEIGNRKVLLPPPVEGNSEQPEIDWGLPSLPVGGEELPEPWAGWVKAFRASNEGCRNVPELQVVAAIRKYQASGLDVGEAIEAFGRQWAGEYPMPPLREFEKYLAKAARMAEGLDSRPLAGGGPAAPAEPPPPPTFKGRGWKKEFQKAAPGTVTERDTKGGAT